MRFGVTTMLTDRTLRPDELAREAEGHGFDSLWLPEHTHIPVGRETPAPMGEPLPEPYHRLLDPFIALTAAAMATETLRVGTGICLVAQHDPVTLAKEIATLDLLSGGRFSFGVGFGWNREELADHGVAFEDRRDVVRDRLLLMERLWEDEVASYDGEHASVAPSHAWPKPVQSPRPPVVLGVGVGERNVELLVEVADGWLPIGASGLREHVPVLRHALEDAGRDPDAFEIVPFGSTPDEGKFAYLRDLGVTEVVINLPSGDRDVLLPALEEAAGVVANYRGDR